MTGLQLLNRLQGLPQEALKLSVYTYLNNAEDGDFPDGIKIQRSDNVPYHKAEDPWACGNASADEDLLWIS